MFGKSISDRLAGGAEFFKKHKMGILLSIGSIGLLVTALKLVYNTSPMMQASVKLLGLMWNLGLRPIGDFFGFVMRPIFIMLLRSFVLPWYKYAYPFYQRWGNKIGEFFTAPSWEKLQELFAELKPDAITAFSLALGGITAMLVIGGSVWLALVGLKNLINNIIKFFGGKVGDTATKTPTPLPTTPTTAQGVPTNVSKFPEHLKPFSSLYSDYEYKPTNTKNVAITKNVQSWMNTQWKKIQAAGQRLNKSMSQMWVSFQKKMLTNPLTSKLLNIGNKLSIGGLKGGVIGFIPAIQEIIMQAINPELYERNRQELFDQYPFLAPDYDPAKPAQEEMQHGGIIREPIYGVGRSGKTYSFGESGAEMVTPMGKGVGGVGITINIQNMSGSTQDLNNLRQTILAVIQESNTRGGRI